MTRRDLLAWSLIGALLALASGAAWVTRHPDSPVLERAERWPGIGRAAAALRRRYLPPPPALPEPVEPDRTLVLPAPPPPPAEGEDDAVFVSGRPADAFWVAPGDSVLARPDEHAAPVATVDRYQAVARLERRGDWNRVRLGTREGWVQRAEPPPGAPPLPPTPVPPRPLPGQRPDPERLAAARRLLEAATGAAGGTTRRLGAYPLFSDLEDSARLARLDRLADEVERLYPRRYGVTPAGPPAETILLFAREATYRTFQAQDARLAALPATGHAGYGLVALFAGTRRDDEVAATLVHELTHLLNRRCLGPALPPWLDEGLAVDLALSAIGPDGSLDPERLGGTIVAEPGRITYLGAQAAARHLETALGGTALPPLGELFALDWEPFVRSDRLELHYSAAGFLWRALLADPATAGPARDFLRSVAAGGPADAEALRTRIGRSWEELTAALERAATTS